MKTHKELLDEYISNLDSQNYYDAHESLEKIWFARRFEDNDEVKLLKGFINAAVCFELIKKGRYDASDKAWKNYLKYRPLLYKVTTPYLNDYHFMARHVENVKISLKSTYNIS